MSSANALKLDNAKILLFVKGIIFLTYKTNDKILDISKLKAFTDNNMNVTNNLKFAYGRAENIVGKGVNAFNIFSFLTIFQKLTSQGH